jgi:hypothetical protein
MKRKALKICSCVNFIVEWKPIPKGSLGAIIAIETITTVIAQITITETTMRLEMAAVAEITEAAIIIAAQITTITIADLTITTIARIIIHQRDKKLKPNQFLIRLFSFKIKWFVLSI